MRITIEMLEAKDACEEQRDEFAKEWPEGAEVTEANLLRALELELDLGWLASKFLPHRSRSAYYKARAQFRKAYEEALAPCMKTYEKALAPYVKAYEEALASLWKEYDEALALESHWKTYKEATAPYGKAYEEALASLWKEYEEAIARELCRLLLLTKELS